MARKKKAKRTKRRPSRGKRKKASTRPPKRKRARTQVAVIGAGYVGLVQAVGLARLGHRVTLVEQIPERVVALQRGECPIYEPELAPLLRRVTRNRRLRATSDLEGSVKEAAAIFLCVGTPSKPDGSIDLSSIEEATREVGLALRGTKGYRLVVVKSTVVPGTTLKVIGPLLQANAGVPVGGASLGLCVNPEFLREGRAVEDFFEPSRIITGSTDPRATRLLRSLYRGLPGTWLEVDPTTAELVKYATNAFLATKISFINEIGNYAKRLGVDVREVSRGLGLDERIGPKFLHAGLGFGGSCFPKDVKALAQAERQAGLEPRLIEAALQVNANQPIILVDRLESRLGSLQGRRIGMLGLAFKAGTDDTRESPAHAVAQELRRRGSTVVAYDPVALENFWRSEPWIEPAPSIEECIRRADAIVLLTEWPQFADAKQYGTKLVVDGRGIVQTANYEGLCW